MNQSLMRSPWPAEWPQTAACATHRRMGRQHGVRVRVPEKRYCTDNAAMIASPLPETDGATDPRRVSARSRVQ